MNLLQFNFPEWFFVALNLLILILVLKRIFWNPVNKILADRQAMAMKTEEDSIASADLRARTEEKFAQADVDIEARTAQMLTDARTRAGREYDRIITDAEEESQRIHAMAKTKADQELEKMLAEARNQVSAMAIEAAGVLLRENMDGARNKKLIEAYLAEKDVSA